MKIGRAQQSPMILSRENNMTTRREFVKLSLGALSVSMAWPVLARATADAKELRTLVIFNQNAPEGHAFFKQLLDDGGELFPISDLLDPARKNQLFQELRKRPSMVVGLTDPGTAFELQMAASDAFHFKVPDDRFVVEGQQNEPLIAWAVAPINEIREGGLR